MSRTRDTEMENLQEDVYYRLLSEPFLADINIKLLRQMQIASEVDEKLIYTKPRSTGGRIGAGVLVGMPSIRVEGTNVNTPGPVSNIVLPIQVFEHPVLNLNATTGTQKSAESIARYIQRLFNHWMLEPYVTLYCDRNAIQPVLDYPGAVVYQVMFTGGMPANELDICDVPLITEDALTVTLTNTSRSMGAAIYYTTDTSFPGPGNPAALLYAAPFTVTTNTTIRWAAYKLNFGTWIGSDVAQAIINDAPLARDEDRSIIDMPEGGGLLP